MFKRHKPYGVTHGILDKILHHLYVCPVGSPQLEWHILFRDYLMMHEEARQQYQNLKYRIDEEANQDRKTYNLLKEEMACKFTDEVIDRARKDKALL